MKNEEKIKRYKTIEENKIENGEILTINYY